MNQRTAFRAAPNATRARSHTFRPAFGHEAAATQPRVALGSLAFGLLLVTGIAIAAGAAGCADGAARPELDQSELESYVRAMLPRRIEVQRYLTKPVSFSGSGDADGLEVILAALDRMNDPTKVVGNFQFELHTLRPASSDPLGQRVAFWPVEVKSDESFLLYWDRFARFYRFPLRLESAALPPGKYILSARLRVPTGDTLFDQYEFTHEGGAVPTVRSR